MLEVLDGAPSGSDAQSSGLETMVTSLVIAESQHEAIEEQFFWPAVRDALDDGDELADAVLEQEQEGKKRLKELVDGVPANRIPAGAAGFRQGRSRAHQLRTGRRVAPIRGRGQPGGSRNAG